MDNRQLARRVWPKHEFTQAIETPSEVKFVKRIILFISAAILALLLWSLLASVEEISKSRGQVIPLGHRQVIQSLSGGTIASVTVSEGDVVKKGDVLANFVAIANQSTKEELASKKANLQLKIERFDAFIHNRAADFNQYQASYPELVHLNIQSLMHMRQEKMAIEKATQSNIEKSTAELQGLKSEILPLKDQISTARKTIAMMTSIDAEQAVSKLRILESQQKLDSYLKELRSMESKQQVLLKNIVNLKRQLTQKQATLMKEVDEKRTDSHAQLLTIIARLKSSSSQVMQDTITAPVDGIIQSIPTTSSGSVIKPGGTVAVIVPTTPTGLMEVKLSPRDIGFVKVGQIARIKIDAFDYSRYGALIGKVQRISPSTDSDQKGGVFYKVKIVIDKPYFTNADKQFSLLPGMTGEADIVTGQKTIFQYLWKPVFTNITGAFGER